LIVVVRWLGILLALLAIWPMAYALDAIGAKDYLGGALLLAITYVLARTGVELTAHHRATDPAPRPLKSGGDVPP
jgi:hypothetical protein